MTLPPWWPSLPGEALMSITVLRRIAEVGLYEGADEVTHLVCLWRWPIGWPNEGI